MRKNKGVSKEAKKLVYKEQLKINTKVANLLNKHTFIVLKKEKNRFPFKNRIGKRRDFSIPDQKYGWR